MAYLQIERSKAGHSWALKVDGQHVDGVMSESREDLIHWALWMSRGEIPEPLVAPLALQSVADSFRRAQPTNNETRG